MPPLVASMISLGFLGAVDTYLTATAFPVPVWVTFIAWASFFACGGGQQGLVKSVVSNWTGIIIASITLLVIQFGPAYPITAAICVGLGTSAMIAVSAIPILNFPPAIVFGFASLVGTSAATDTTIVTPGMTHPTLVAMAAMLLGGLFGYVSELGTQLLASRKSATA
ncbi:DUF1097 domain-containing protein [Phyllobacterium sp. LjRoot231]|uniref:DUF1097 domain-containing protein n=1 Tax=Phyllobacterium sp. LjRoot231 TaxID=3342289 RepID=UPI003ECC7F9C